MLFSSFGIMPLEATPSPGQAQKPVIFPSKDLFSEMFGTQDIIKAPKKVIDVPLLNVVTISHSIQ